MRALTVVMVVAAVCMFVAGCQQKKSDTIPQTDLRDISEQPEELGTSEGATTGAVRPDVQEIGAPAGKATTYTMKAGDTLYSLAKRYYGDGKKWTKIFEANKDKIKDVTDIPIGTVIVIPADQ